MVILPQTSFARGGSGYAVLDGDTGRVLIGSNSNERLPIASLTKIWTTLVLSKIVTCKRKLSFHLRLPWLKGVPFICRQAKR
ncbi:hypothetical protein AABM34_06265 [Lysinibacillus fusiformis]